MERFSTKALQRRVTQLGNAVLYISLASSVSLAKGGAQSVAVEREVTGNGKEVDVHYVLYITVNCRTKY